MNKYGYRSVWYNAKKRCMHLWSWDDNGNRTESVEPFSPYLYIETTQKADALSIFDTNLKKITFPSQFERRRYVKDCGIKRLFFNLKAEQQFLLEKYNGLNDTVDFSLQPIKICALDIEVYAHEFPDPQQAKHPINLLTIFDSISKQYHTFGLKPYTPSSPDVVYHYCSSESDLLQKFINHWSSDYPDVVIGWNSDGFDIPYIINRINNVLGEEYSRKLSPVDSIYYKENIAQKFGKTIGKWIIHGINCVDYKEIYETFSREKRESYSLDYISKVELNEGKIKINTTNLTALSDKFWTEYVDYNIQDVALLNKLEEKLRFLKTMRLISHKGFCNIESTLGKVMVVSGAIAAQALKRNQILCTFEHEDMGNYAGGYVKEVDPGLREGVVTFDANSLYPNTIITLNISPETKIGKIINVDNAANQIEIKLINGKMHTINIDSFAQFIKNEKISISKAKILFTQKNKGIVPEYVDTLYAERVQVKNTMKIREKELRKLLKESKGEQTEKTIGIKSDIDRLDNLQSSVKLLLNSIYGVFANKYGPLYDIDCASSITLTGQAAIKEASDILDKYAADKYKVTLPITHYGDTDSCHISIQPILNELNQPLLEEDGKIAANVYPLVNEINAHLNKSINEWSKDALNSIDSRFYFKRENICSTGLYQAKKRYILHIKDKGDDAPIPCDYIKPVGVELVKSTMSDEIKKMIKNIIVVMLNTKDRLKTIEAYRKVYETFKTMPEGEIAFRSAIKTYDKYAPQAIGFSKAKRTPVAVAGAIYYNNLLKEYNLTNQYETLKAGDRVRWVYCHPANHYNIQNIAFADTIPKEFKDISADYDKMFKTIIEPAVTRLFNCASWKMIDLQAEYTVDLLDFFKE